LILINFFYINVDFLFKKIIKNGLNFFKYPAVQKKSRAESPWYPLWGDVSEFFSLDSVIRDQYPINFTHTKKSVILGPQRLYQWVIFTETVSKGCGQACKKVVKKVVEKCNFA
jgi:hypothetical protein